MACCLWPMVYHAYVKKKLLLSALVTVLAALAVFAQTGGPTKVTGKPKTTSSGVQYWDIVPGTGATAVSGKKVTVNYTGWLTSGKQFDSSVGKRPFQFKLGGGEVIQGWDDGVAGMKVGGKRQLKIPPNLGYGSRGAAGVIPPNATLIFDVRLVSVAP